MAQYDHVDHLVEYKVIRGVPSFQRTLLKLKRPYFNHTGFQSATWSPELNTLLLALGDGGSEYDPNNIAQNDKQLSGKLLKIDLEKLQGADITAAAPVPTFADLRAQQVPEGAFTPLIKGLRNPSKVHHERIEEDVNDEGNGKDNGRHNGNGNGVAGDDVRWIKYLANTGQDTLEYIHGFDHYGINFGFRPWEGIFPTSFETLQEVQPTHLFNVDLSGANLQGDDVYSTPRSTPTRMATGSLLADSRNSNSSATSEITPSELAPFMKW